MSEEEVVKLVFPESKREEDKEVKALLQPTGYEKKNRIFDVEEILNWFKKLKVKQIELWMETSVKSGNVISLLVSAEGKGGVKVTLEPKTETTETN